MDILIFIALYKIYFIYYLRSHVYYHIYIRIIICIIFLYTLSRCTIEYAMNTKLHMRNMDSEDIKNKQLNFKFLRHQLPLRTPVNIVVTK